MPRPTGPQFKFLYQEDPDNEVERHTVTTQHTPTGAYAGSMIWSGYEDTDNGHLQSIEVDPKFRRQGLATKMWNHARELSYKNPNIHFPQHSAFRTPEGDAWARAVTEDGTKDWLPYNQYKD
jgi:GNAT superfamily N-acetyltransferase